MKKIIYIAGSGHSGSTLLDIILGTQENFVSLGELYYLPDKGIINNQYCSCGKRVLDCHFWGDIITEWEAKRQLTLLNYLKYQRFYLSLKNIYILYLNYIFPSKNFRLYLKDTKILYNIIFEKTNNSILIDSSKIPNQILILKKIGFDLHVIHLTRKFSSVLNSYKKEFKKDLSKGIEKDIRPSKTISVIFHWLLYNLFIILYSNGIYKTKIKYENIIKNLKKELNKLTSIDKYPNNLIKNRGPFIPGHLVAGNRIRMKNKIFVSRKPHDVELSKLSKLDKMLAFFIDFFY